jgi:hypothetical protein
MKRLPAFLLRSLLALALVLAPVFTAALQAADITQASGSVAPGAGAIRIVGTAGEVITAGQPVYQDPATGLLFKAKADTVVHAAAVGIALGGASANQPFVYQTTGQINVGATLVIGQWYVVSPTNFGGIAPLSDLTTGNFGTVLGYATAPTSLQLTITPSGVAHG